MFAKEESEGAIAWDECIHNDIYEIDDQQVPTV